jgi:hypothetical protein
MHLTGLRLQEEGHREGVLVHGLFLGGPLVVEELSQVGDRVFEDGICEGLREAGSLSMGVS